MSYLASAQPQPIEEAAQRVAERDADVAAALEAVREARAGIEAATAEDKLLLADALDKGRDDPGQPNRDRAERALAEAERRLGAEELRASAAREELKKATAQHGERWLRNVVSALAKAEKASVGALERLRDCEVRRAQLRGDLLWVEGLLSGKQPSGPVATTQNTPLVRNASGDRLQLTELLDGIGGFLAETSFERDEHDRAARDEARAVEARRAALRQSHPLLDIHIANDELSLDAAEQVASGERDLDSALQEARALRAAARPSAAIYG